MKKTIRNIQYSKYAWLALAVFFYLFSLLFNNSVTQQSSTNQERFKLQQYAKTNQERFETIAADTTLISELSGRIKGPDVLNEMINEKTGIFIYHANPFSIPELKFWSNQYSSPPDKLHSLPDGEYFEKLKNGYNICLKKTITEKNSNSYYVVIGLIPVLYEYYVKTVNFPTEFAHNKNAVKKISISDTVTDLPINGLSGNPLFYIAPRVQSIVMPTGLFTNIFRIFSVLFLILFIHFTAERITNMAGIWKGIGFLIAILVILRTISYYTNFPLNLRQFELFDPKFYGSNSILKSLGDLLINALLFFWIVLYAWLKLIKTENHLLPGDGKSNYLKAVIGIVAITGVTFLMAATIRSLAADSQISFDVINFFSLSKFTVFGFVVLSVISIGYYFFMRILLWFLYSQLRNNFHFAYFFIAIAGLIYLTVISGSILLPFFLVVITWLLFYIRLQTLKRFSINKSRLNMAGTLFWIFLFSVSITAVIINANSEKEWEVRKRFAYRIHLQTDPYNERQLSIAFTYIDEDFLSANFHRFSNEQSAKFLRDSILRESGFLNKYETRLYVFDSEKKPLYNDNTETFNELNTIISVQANATQTPHLYYYETAFDKFTFIFKRDAVNASGKILGSIFILSNPEQHNADALYPELFRQANQPNPEESPAYSYGIYKKGILFSGPLNKYSFPTKLLPADIPEAKYEKRPNQEYNELWYKASNDKVVVIAKKRESVIEAITLFSYIFCAFLFLVAIFSLLALILRVGGNLKKFQELLQWNIRTQVHGTIIFISILSFVIIGVATISFFIQRYEQNNQDKLSRTMEIMLKEMEKKLIRQQVFDDQLPFYDSVANQEVVRLVNEVAEIHNVDVNVYDTSGTLHVSSHPIIYPEGLLSKKIHPLAFYHLNKLRQVQYVQQEKLANISYLSIYAPLRGDDGIAYAYLNIPYFLSQKELKQEISNFLVTIINLNAFIFLIAGVIALFITNRVTRSFSLISEKMQEVNLGKANEEIDWKRDDEIGELVREYNKMVKKLEVSAAALARSEREGAWREMARQVAHEIKNPLTPMKLSVQYLQKSIDNNSGNVKELTASVAKTLVEQIDHLSKIAFDFSQFANIGNNNPETFDLKEVLQSVSDLYGVNDNVELELKEFPDEMILYSDKTQMNRLFTNLLQNAVEACTGRTKCRISIDAVKNNGVVRISVSDNGEGIPEFMQTKIFTPNFTTKSSGTGLGLAICKGIVEQAKGNIWFETKKGEGSIFYVELPLAN